MISSSALPNTISGRPNSFAVLSLNLHSLDEHDKKTIGKLSDYDILDLNGEDYVEAVDSEDLVAELTCCVKLALGPKIAAYSLLLFSLLYFCILVIA